MATINITKHTKTKIAIGLCRNVINGDSHGKEVGLCTLPQFITIGTPRKILDKKKELDAVQTIIGDGYNIFIHGHGKWWSARYPYKTIVQLQNLVDNIAPEERIVINDFWY